MRLRHRRMRSAAAAAMAMVVLTTAATACSSSQEASCEPAAIAYVGPLTGPTSALGRPIRNAVALAIANQDPDTCQIGLVEFDTQGDPEQAVPIVTQIIDQPDIVGVVGPTQSAETSAALPILEAAGLAVITPSATNPALSTRGWRSFHRMVTTDATQGPAIASYLITELGLDRIAILDDGDLYGDGIADLVASSVVDLGGEVVARRTIDPASRDYTSAIDVVTAAEPDALFFGGTDIVAARTVRQLRESGRSTLFAVPDAVFTDEFLVTSGPAAEGTVVTCPCASAANAQRTSLRLFASRYLDTFGTTPGPFGAEAYDAAAILVQAIEEAGPNRRAVLAAVKDITLEGVTGSVSFDETGEVSEGPVYIYVVEDGRFVPTAEVVGDVVIPAGRR